MVFNAAVDALAVEAPPSCSEFSEVSDECGPIVAKHEHGDGRGEAVGEEACGERVAS